MYELGQYPWTCTLHCMKCSACVSLGLRNRTRLVLSLTITPILLQFLDITSPLPLHPLYPPGQRC